MVKTKLPRKPVCAVDRHAVGVIVEKGKPPREGNKGGIDNPPGNRVVPACSTDKKTGGKKALANTNYPGGNRAVGARDKVFRDVTHLVPSDVTAAAKPSLRLGPVGGC